MAILYVLELCHEILMTIMHVLYQGERRSFMILLDATWPT